MYIETNLLFLKIQLKNKLDYIPTHRKSVAHRGTVYVADVFLTRFVQIIFLIK